MDLLVSTAAGNEIGLWRESRPQNFQQAGLLKVFSDTTSCQSLSWNSNNYYLACAPDGGDHVVVLSCERNQINIARQIESKSLLEIGTSEHVGGVSSCCFLGNGHQLVIGLTSPLVSLWDIDTNVVTRNYVGHSTGVTCLSRNSKDTHIVSGVENGLLYIHKLSSSQPLVNLSAGITERVTCVKFSLTEQSMIGSCGNTGAVRLWSAESQRLLATFSVTHTGGANSIAFSPYNRMLMASVGQDNMICLYDLIQRKTITQISCPVPMSSILLMKDGVTMIGGANDGKLYVYNMRNCKEPCHVIAAHDKPIRSLAAQNVIKAKTGRKLPGKATKKAVTIESPSEIGTPPSDGISPLLANIVTPAPTNKPANISSVFSPLETSEAPLPVEAAIPPVSHLFTPSPTVVDTKKVSFSSETPAQTKLSSSIVDIFSPLNTSNVTMSRPLTSDKVKPFLSHLQPNPTAITSFPSESTILVKGQSLGATTLANTIDSTQLQNPLIQSTPATTILPKTEKSKSPDPQTAKLSPAPPPIQTDTSSLPPIQMQFLENLLKEQQEEITWSIHRDINNLSVTMLRQFATLQNQMVMALTSISERVDKLNEEVEHLKHQINHITPKY